jgi:hypothetical protein
LITRVLVKLPAGWPTARAEWVAGAVLRDILGFDIDLQTHADSSGVSIEVPGDGRKLEVVGSALAEGVFSGPGGVEPARGTWDAQVELPELPEARPLPLPYWVSPTSPGARVLLGASSCCLDLDVFGFAFFMLSRFEELDRSDLDQHERYPRAKSFTFRSATYERPVVDEYCRVLLSCMRRLWPDLVTRAGRFRVVPSHDVDRPFRYNGKPLGGADALIRDFGVAALRERSPRYGARRLAAWLRTTFRGAEFDPYSSYDWLMATSEESGLRSTFYFITAGEHKYDGGYSVEQGPVADVIRRIGVRGHELGLHGSYCTYQDARALKGELDILKRSALNAGFAQDQWGGRQHYVRWEPQTWARAEEAGLACDSTLSFVESGGFRAGTSHEYSAFDLIHDRTLDLRVRPLIFMDTCVMMDLVTAREQAKHAAIHDYIVSLREACRLYDGNFVFLWHNNTLSSPWQRELYRSVLH